MESVARFSFSMCGRNKHWAQIKNQGAVAGVISGFVIDLGWLLTGMTASTGIFEIVPGFFGSLVVAIIVAKLTSAPNEKAVAIFEQGTSKNADWVHRFKNAQRHSWIIFLLVKDPVS